MGHFRQGLALEAHQGQGGELLVAVLSQHVGGDRTAVHPGIQGEPGKETGGVKARAGAEDPAPGQPQLFGHIAGDDIAGVGDVQEDALEAGGLDLGSDFLGSGHGEAHFVEAVPAGSGEADFAGGIHQYVGIADIGVGACIDLGPAGHVDHAGVDVHGLAFSFFPVNIYEHDFCGNALIDQIAEHMGPYMS